MVCKLFLQCGADRAWFGEKDYQQLKVVERMARDLDIPTEVVAAPTVRETDGLAVSSRNVRLTGAQRAVAPALARALSETAAAVAGGGAGRRRRGAGPRGARGGGIRPCRLSRMPGRRKPSNRSPASRPAARRREVFGAAWLGEVRLIDNLPVAPAA